MGFRDFTAFQKSRKKMTAGHKRTNLGNQTYVKYKK